MSLGLAVRRGYIYLKNHSVKAYKPYYPMKFEDPRLVPENAPPKVPFLESKLNKEVSRVLAEKEFRFFRDRMVESSGIPDEEPPDPQAERAQWYFQGKKQSELFRLGKQYLAFRNRFEDHLSEFNCSRVPEEDLAKPFSELSFDKYTLGDYLVSKSKQPSAEDHLLWLEVERSIGNDLQTLSTMELAKILYSACSSSPKKGSFKLRSTINDLLLEDLHKSDLKTVVHVAQSFRMVKDWERDQILIKRVGELSKTASNNEIIDLIWTATNCRNAPYNVNFKYRDIDHRRKTARKAIDPLVDRLDLAQCSFDQCIKFLLCLYKNSLDNYKPQLLQIQRKLIPVANELDAYQTAQFIFLLSKMEDGRGFGSKALYVSLYRRAMQLWPEFDNLQRSRILHTYYNFKIVPAELNDKLLQLSSNMEGMPYNVLVNVVACLLMSHQMTPERLAALNLSVMGQSEPVPMPYFRTFKLALLYGKGQAWLKELEGALQNSEFYFDVMRNQNYYSRDAENQIVLNSFTNKYIDLNFCQPFQNSIIVDYEVPGKRAGLLLATSRWLLPFDPSVTTAAFDLKKQVLQLNNFYCKAITLPEYLAMDKYTRDDQILSALTPFTAQGDAYEAELKPVEHQRLYIKERQQLLLSMTPNELENQVQKMPKEAYSEFVRTLYKQPTPLRDQFQEKQRVLNLELQTSYAEQFWSGVDRLA